MSDMNVEVSKIYVNDGTNHTKLAYEEPYAPCSFTNGTDAEIKKALEKHYAGKINLADYWSVGDTRLIHLNAMQAPSPNGSSTWAAQDITIVIVDMNHHDLATTINGVSKAAVTVQTREVMNNNSSGYNQSGHIYANGDSSVDMMFAKWSDLYIRTYLNSTVLEAIPSGDFKSAIKPSKHYRHSEEVTDTLFLPSYPEIFGTASYSYYAVTNPVEGTQWGYYTIAANRIKNGNNNGLSNGVAQMWWEGSPGSRYTSSSGYTWGSVNTNGTANYVYGTHAAGLAPAFVM